MWLNPDKITKIAKLLVATLATLATFQPESIAEYPTVAEVAIVATAHDSKITRNALTNIMAHTDG